MTINQPPSLAIDQFNFLADMVSRNSGIILDAGKRYLIESRLRPLAKSEGFSSLQDMVNSLHSRPNRHLVDRIVDSMTTNETSFFRDNHPFALLRDVLLPEAVQRTQNKKRLRLWSAACSTGQEPYSMAMVIREHFAFLLNWDMRIHATDLSPTVLKKAKDGRYKCFEVDRGIPEDLRDHWMKRDGDSWKMIPSLQGMIDFSEQNLLDPFRESGPFDIIFLRNVMIYFDEDTRIRILNKMRRVLSTDGVLVLGSTEAVPDNLKGFERCQHPRVSAYRRLP